MPPSVSLNVRRHEIDDSFVTQSSQRIAARTSLSQGPVVQ